ncbi:hypothetical protein FJZ55_10590 [Candidatus Woesearchaeota archaeon]|nr:hypothetical protein [Candidatus Woesearchaeota archaeon]
MKKTYSEPDVLGYGALGSVVNVLMVVLAILLANLYFPGNRTFANLAQCAIILGIFPTGLCCLQSLFASFELYCIAMTINGFFWGVMIGIICHAMRNRSPKE